MEYKLIALDTCFLCDKIEATASMTGATLKKVPVDSTDGIPTPILRHPALCIADGIVNGPEAVIRYLARAAPETRLGGNGVAESAIIDGLVDYIRNEIEIPILGFINGADKTRVVADITAVFTKFSCKLTYFSFLAGHRMSIADISLAASAYNIQKMGILDVTAFPQIVRIVNTVAGRAKLNWSLKTDCSAKTCCIKQKAADDKPAPQPKQAEEYPPTSFDMDEWKRMYSCSKDLRGEAMPFLWSKYDSSALSMWKVKYVRYNDAENVKSYQASNLISMFIQRIQNPVRKVAFGVFDILNSGTHYEIEGVLMTRGLELPALLKEHDQFESFTWTKICHEADREYIENFFCENDKINGAEIADCKVYK